VALRSVALVSLLAALAIGGWIFLAPSREVGPTSALGERAQAHAGERVAAANFQAAAPLLQAHHVETGTYAGAVLPPNLGVALVRADATSYCLEAQAGSVAQHVAGPGGSPVRGPC
jgi:hypothetical protein